MEKQPLIYVVDDTPETAELFAHFLVSGGYQFELFDTGSSLLTNLQRSALLPDLILLDLMMPEMDGNEVLRAIRKNPLISYVPIIMITSSGETYNRIQGLEAGADDFLTKPINRAELLARVRSILRLKQAYDEKAKLFQEMQRAFNDLAAARSELAEADKSKLQMDTMMTTAAGICHEMSQPLTSALITLQLLRQVQDERTVEDIDTIEISLLQARTILDKLRALTRYETKTYLGEEVILDIDRSSKT